MNVLKKGIVVFVIALCYVTNVKALTSNEITYDNNGTTESLTDTLNTLYTELKKYKTSGTVEANQMLEGKTGYSKGELVTGTIPSKEAGTYKPGTANQTIFAGQYLSGDQTIEGDSDLVAGNIKSGVNIFGVAGTFTSDANATAENILSGKTAYVNGSKVTGTIPSKGITTYTPGKNNQTITSGQYLSGAQTIAGDIDLVAGNIKSGVNIFGVVGTFTSDANATAANILKDKTAYVNGSKVTGTIPSKGVATYTPGKSNQTIASGQYLSGVQTIVGDADLVAGNIKSGVNIFGVAGTFTSDANATAANILKDKTAYVNGTKVTGTMPNYSAQTVTAMNKTTSGSDIIIDIPSAGYYGTDSKIKVSGGGQKSIVYLGEGTSFDVKSYSGYESFTVDNFIVECNNATSSTASFYCNGCTITSYSNGSLTVNKTFSDGVLNASCHVATSIWSSMGHGRSGAADGKVKAYLVLD